MGVEYYLVDDEGKNVLDCGKWYALRPEDYCNVTTADIEAARMCEKLGDDRATQIADIAIRWVVEVCSGRRVRLVTDDWCDEPWLNHQTYAQLPGWTMYEDVSGGWRVVEPRKRDQGSNHG